KWWSKHHFDRPSGKYRFTEGQLSDEDTALLTRTGEYVAGFALESVDAYNARMLKMAKKGSEGKKGKEGKKGDSKKKVRLTTDGQSVVRLIDVFCVIAEKGEAGRRHIFGEDLRV
ncbi:hypothetical protein A2U01_0062406, partial [Trifolium medium]|nr:hypothetical protein [Trifolium medium]